MDISLCLLTGGSSVQRNREELRDKPQVLIGTPEEF